jgi:hypothetical protein
LDAAPPSPIALHPSLPQLYRRKVEQLEGLLADPELAGEAMEAIRALITKIVLTPRPEGALAAVLHGDLAQILSKRKLSLTFLAGERSSRLVEPEIAA